MFGICKSENNGPTKKLRETVETNRQHVSAPEGVPQTTDNRIVVAVRVFGWAPIRTFCSLPTVQRLA